MPSFLSCKLCENLSFLRECLTRWPMCLFPDSEHLKSFCPRHCGGVLRTCPRYLIPGLCLRELPLPAGTGTWDSCSFSLPVWFQNTPELGFQQSFPCLWQSLPPLLEHYGFFFPPLGSFKMCSSVIFILPAIGFILPASMNLNCKV